MRFTAGVLFTWLAVSGCRQAPVAAPIGATGVVVLDASTAAPGAGRSEAVDASIKTTAGKLAVGNLEGQIEEISKITDAPRRASALTDLVSLLTARAQFLGRIEDYELALSDADALVALTPKDPKAYLTRAHARSSLHLFKEALEDLDRAGQLEKHSDRALDIEDQRASIWQAMGRTADAIAIYRQRAAANPDISTLGALGVALADQGKIDEADALLTKAPTVYRNGSPFPVAWTEFQRGQIWERQGQPAKAIVYYRAAADRLPAYAVAQAHLAGLLAAEGDRAQGIERLREVTKTATDPEFVGQLAGLLEEAGQHDEAVKMRAEATAGFEKLLSKHPAAFADHAARFYLGPGATPKRALDLAKLNLEGRQSPDAFDLGLTAALEAGDTATACHLAEQAAIALPTIPTPHLSFLVSKGRSGCRGSGTEAGATASSPEH